MAEEQGVHLDSQTNLYFILSLSAAGACSVEQHHSCSDLVVLICIFFLSALGKTSKDAKYSSIHLFKN